MKHNFRNYLTSKEVEIIKKAELAAFPEFNNCREFLMAQCKTGARFDEIKKQIPFKDNKYFQNEDCYCILLEGLLAALKIDKKLASVSLGQHTYAMNQLVDRVRVGVSEAKKNTVIKNYTSKKSNHSLDKFNELPNGSKYLTAEEVAAIQDIDLEDDDPLKGIRDSFLLQCYTGVRLSDCVKDEDIEFYNTGVGTLLLIVGIAKPSVTFRTAKGDAWGWFYPDPKLASHTYTINTHLHGPVMFNDANL